ncbi:hypothetical protein CCHR01_09564 [Colletotrichum chrysophilum]|uniref:Uncharacterized protein n=1 Tax=Colletotrichum chrysophilum TaxID=1836956 RepID=A0AAD9AJI6_9PEZI|nr:hypothetical protein CCHR01_09564 [Colletotrichum chrysophilum]
MAFWGLPLQKKTSMLSTIVRKALSHSVKEQRRLIIVLLSFRALGASIAYFRVSAETPPLFSFFHRPPPASISSRRGGDNPLDDLRYPHSSLSSAPPVRPACAPSCPANTAYNSVTLHPIRHRAIRMQSGPAARSTAEENRRKPYCVLLLARPSTEGEPHLKDRRFPGHKATVVERQRQRLVGRM